MYACMLVQVCSATYIHYLMCVHLFLRHSSITVSSLLILLSGWFEIDEQQNHNVYVSGLPSDVTKEEFVELMAKCGIIMENEDGIEKLSDHFQEVLFAICHLHPIPS